MMLPYSIKVSDAPSLADPQVARFLEEAAQQRDP